MKVLRGLFIIGTLLVMLLGLAMLNGPTVSVARADGPTPTPTLLPQRKTTVVAAFTFYDWWMVRWQNNHAACRVLVEHPGIPTSAEILASCGADLHREWKLTKTCPEAANGLTLTQCDGMYLHFLRSFPMERKVEVKLALPQVWLSLDGCNPDPTLNRCTTVPQLKFTGEEPLPNEVIIRIQGNINGVPFSCPGNECSVPLSPTGLQGVSLDFYADSSFGDSSEHYTGLIRIIPQGDFMAPDGEKSDSPVWYVDVLSSQWRDGTLASCSDVWQVFPDVGGPPDWLTTPLDVKDLESVRTYYYLAGTLIEAKVVDVSGCPDGGLQAPHTANQCGVEAAGPAMRSWQNRFDPEILNVANQTGIPGQLLKNLFGRESQFWPGMYENYKEAGLGQLTEKGADTLLLWNPRFYNQFCPLVLSQDACNLGFGNLKSVEQNLLRGALVTKVNAACPDCPMGIDLSQANYSVSVFAESLLANCNQTGKLLTNITSRSPGQVSTYVDLWRFTLVNYNAGAGCLSRAVKLAWQAGDRLDWANVTKRLEPVCQSAIGYVDDVSQVQRIVPTPTAWVFGGTAVAPPVYPTAPAIRVTGTPTLRPNATATPAPTSTPQPTFTPGPSPTEGSYPAPGSTTYP